MKLPLWLAVGLVALIVGNAITLVGTLSITSGASGYSALNVPFSPFARAALAALWLLVLTVLFMNLLRRVANAFRWTAPVLSAYGLGSLLWDVTFVRSDYGRGAFVFRAVVTGLLLIPVWWQHRRWALRVSDADRPGIDSAPDPR